MGLTCLWLEATRGRALRDSVAIVGMESSSSKWYLVRVSISFEPVTVLTSLYKFFFNFHSNIKR